MLAELRPKGRLSRGGFWIRHFTTVPLALALAIAVQESLGDVPGTVAALLLILLLISIWGRRLHDRGRSAWWLLLTCIPLLGPLALFVECGFRKTAVPAQSGPDYLSVR